jgi:hypothetical protein
MAKSLRLFEDTRERAWPPHFFEDASKATGIQFIMGAKDEGPHADLPSSLTNYGFMEQPVFLDALSQSLVLIGIGRPATYVKLYQEHQKYASLLIADHRHRTKLCA